MVDVLASQADGHPRIHDRLHISDSAISLSDFAESFLIDARVRAQLHELHPSAAHAVHNWLSEMVDDARIGRADLVARWASIINAKITYEIEAPA